MWNSCTGLFATRGPDRPLERAGAFAAEDAEPTARVRELVEAARVAAAQRLTGSGSSRYSPSWNSGGNLRRRSQDLSFLRCDSIGSSGRENRP